MYRVQSTDTEVGQPFFFHQETFSLYFKPFGNNFKFELNKKKYYYLQFHFDL